MTARELLAKLEKSDPDRLVVLEIFDEELGRWRLCEAGSAQHEPRDVKAHEFRILANLPPLAEEAP